MTGAVISFVLLMTTTGLESVLAAAPPEVCRQNANRDVDGLHFSAWVNITGWGCGTLKDPNIGVTDSSGTGSGENTANRSSELREGLSFQMAIQSAPPGPGERGTRGGAGGADVGQGSQGRVTLVSQSSTGATNQECGATRYAAWSRFISSNWQCDRPGTHV
jgi:hypothetical protein